MNLTPVVLIALSSLSLIASGTTLTIVVIGAKKMKVELAEVRMKSNKTVRNLQHALANLEF